MNKILTVVLFILFCTISVAYPMQKSSKLTKSRIICQRQCFYNYYGPGAHCDEKCLKTDYSAPALDNHAT
jgi:hypothetical protein